MFVSAVRVVATYFTTKRAFEIGIVATGSSFDSIFYLIMVYRLINDVGYPWAARIFRFVALGTSILPWVLLRSRLPSRRIRLPVDLASQG